MITWLKLMASARFIVPNVIAVALVCCQDLPIAGVMTPNIGSQGTDLLVTFTGSNFTPQCTYGLFIIIDGVTNGGSDGLSTDFNFEQDPHSATAIPFTLHIAANARIGAHWIAVQTGSGVSAPLKFTVTCPGCPALPELLNLVNQTGSPLVPSGPPVTFEFVGTNFLNNNPQVQIDGPGITFPPGPYNVQGGGGGYDYFFLDITADASATSGIHNVRVTTGGGTSNTFPLTVNASQPPPSPSPSSSPALWRITPTHITKGQQVSIKLEGSGFGTRRSIITDQGYDFQVEGTYQAADPNTVVVGTGEFFTDIPDAWVTVRVHNVDNNTTSDGSILFLDELDTNKPLVTGVSGPVYQGGDADVAVGGYNMRGVTEQSLSGIPGLHFSNVQPDPNFPDNIFRVHVHADGITNVTGDEATNLTITTTNGQSGPFLFRIFPPLPP